MKKIKRLLFVIFILLLAILVALNFYFDGLIKNMDQSEGKIDKDDLGISDTFKQTHKGTNVTNIMLFGVDNNDNSTASLDEARSDAIKVISLDYSTRKVKITSLERDLVVYLPGEYQDFGHLNWAYAFGGSKLALQTINYNFDLDIDKYVTVSFGGLELLVDLVGGVDIYVTQAEIDQTFIPLYIDGPEGVYTLNGSQALSYSRIRKIDSDFARMDRQNAVIQALIVKLKQLNPLQLMDTVTKMLPYVNTNLTANQIKVLMAEIAIFDLDNIETYKEPAGELADLYPAQGIGGNYVSSYVDMVSNLHKNIYGIQDYEPSQTVYDTQAEIYYRYAY